MDFGFPSIDRPREQHTQFEHKIIQKTHAELTPPHEPIREFYRFRNDKGTATRGSDSALLSSIEESPKAKMQWPDPTI